MRSISLETAKVSDFSNVRIARSLCPARIWTSASATYASASCFLDSEIARRAAMVARAGKIVWIGNPRDLKDVLTAVFAEKWTPEGRKEMYEQGAAATKRFMEFEKNLNILIDRRQWDAALKVITEIEKDTNKSLAREGRLLRVSILQQSGKTSEALELCDSLVTNSNDWEVASEVAKMLASPLFPKPDLARATIAALRCQARGSESQRFG